MKVLGLAVALLEYKTVSAEAPSIADGVFRHGKWSDIFKSRRMPHLFLAIRMPLIKYFVMAQWFFYQNAPLCLYASLTTENRRGAPPLRVRKSVQGR